MTREEDLKRRIEQLEERLARVEGLLGPALSQDEPAMVEPPPVADLTPPPAVPAPPPIIEIPPPPVPHTPRPFSESLSRIQSAQPPPVEPPATEQPAAPPMAPVHAVPPRVSPPPVQAPPIVVHRPQPAERPIDGGKAPASLEVMVGVKLAAWIGAVAVVAAVGFFLKLAYTKGWWSLVSHEARCLMGAGFGLALIGAGEFALRRVGRAAAVGLYSAGLATLYLVAWAAFVYFGLIGKEAAFIYMGLVAIGGFACTLHTRSLTIGVLSLLGGYATPIMVGGGGGHDLELLSFLTLMLGIALGLSAVRPRPYRALRYVALGGQAVITIVWLATGGYRQWELGIFFFSVWWAMVLAESTFAALRRQSSVGNIVTTLVATGFYATAGTWLLDRAVIGFDWTGAFTAAVAVLGAAVAFQFGPGLEALRGQARSAMDKLAIALWAQSGILITVAVALQFDDYGQSIAWLALGLGAVELCRRLPSRGVGIFGLIVGGLAIGRIVLFDSWASAPLRQTLLEIGPATDLWIVLTRWGLLGLIAIATTHVAARRLGLPSRHLDRFQPWKVMPLLLAAAGSLGWLGLTMVQCRDLAITTAWLVGAAVLIGVHRWGRPLAYRAIGMGLLLMTAARWLIADAMLPRMDPGWNAAETLPLLNGQMGLAVAIAAVGWWAFSITRREPRAAGDQTPAGATTAAQIILIVAATFLLVAFSFQVDLAVNRIAVTAAETIRWSVDHARQLMLTLLWSLGGLAVAVIARNMLPRSGAGPRLVIGFAWLVLIGCALKWLVIDTLHFALTEQLVNGLLPVTNIQLLVGVVLATAAVVLVTMTPALALEEDPRPWSPLLAWVPAAAAVLVLWGLSFEIDRVLAQWLEPTTAWPDLQRHALWLTGLWAIGAIAMMGLARISHQHLLRLRRPPAGSVAFGTSRLRRHDEPSSPRWPHLLASERSTHPRDDVGEKCGPGHVRRLPSLAVGGCIIAIGTALAYLTIDTLGFRIAQSAAPVTVVFNLQFAAGALVTAALAGSAWLYRNRPQLDHWIHSVPAVALAFAGLVLLWMGSLEIDRALAADHVQTGLSVYWCAFGVTLVLLGFARRVATARYAGLALLGITAVKVFFVDLSSVETEWRVLSFLVLGLLLIGTSIVYAKLAPRMLGNEG